MKIVYFLGFKVNLFQKKKIIYLCEAYNGFSIKMHLDILFNITINNFIQHRE